VRRVSGGIRRPREPPVPRPADRVPGLRPPAAAARRPRTDGGSRRPPGGVRGRDPRRPHRGPEGPRGLSPRLRRPRREGGWGVAGGRGHSAGEDEREPVRRTDRVPGRRRTDPAGGGRRPIPDARPADPRPLRRLGDPRGPGDRTAAAAVAWVRPATGPAAGGV